MSERERHHPSSVYDGEQKACPWCGHPGALDVLGRRFCGNWACDFLDPFNPPDEEKAA